MRDLTGLSRACQVFLVLQAVLSGLSVALALGGGDALADAAPLLLAQFLLGCATAISVLLWVHRSTANAHASGASGLGSGPALAVAWYFIPIANLFKPVATMIETWKASIDRNDWETVRSPAMLGWWWGFWLVSSIAGTAGWRIGEVGGSDTALWAERLTLASDLTFIPASLLLARIIAAISRQQAELGAARH